MPKDAGAHLRITPQERERAMKRINQFVDAVEQVQKEHMQMDIKSLFEQVEELKRQVSGLDAYLVEKVRYFEDRLNQSLTQSGEKPHVNWQVIVWRYGGETLVLDTYAHTAYGALTNVAENYINIQGGLDEVQMVGVVPMHDITVYTYNLKDGEWQKEDE